MRKLRNDNLSKSFKHLFDAFFYSMAGLKSCFKNETAFRQECFLALIALPLSFYLGQTGVEKALLAGTFLMIMVVELLNASLEKTVDRISLERHDLSKQAKDMGSAAVFVAILVAAVTWICILFG
ncbi:MAG: diacylglycerol kinase [Alphaproteobacteria bacterium]|nr:diacylglycerol kinase [Alphaproteobacteria bacterium]|tara:strand:+ start:91 stop:465 length:375 start_codon:yes stop_codon:yes gene_type:complete